MRENKYDGPVFFEKYSQMSRSQGGLAAAGEWESLRVPASMLEIPGMRDELRRPMMLIVSAVKQ